MSQRKTYSIRDVERSLGQFYPPQCHGPYAYESKSAYNSYSNYGAHAMEFSFAGVSFYFSYKTLIAAKFPGRPLLVRRNIWGPTTGMHISHARKVHGFGIAGLTEAEFAIMYAQYSAEHFGIKGVPDFAMGVEPGSHDRTGHIVKRRDHEYKLPPSEHSSKFETEPVPPITTKKDAARRRRLDLEKAKREEKRKKALFLKRSEAAKKAAATRREKLEAEERRRRWAEMLQDDVMFDLQTVELEMV